MSRELDVMDGSRHRDTYRGASIYSSIFRDEDGGFYDLIPSISSEALNLDQNTLSNIDALAKMTSLALREYDPLYVMGKLLECARGPNTLPSIFANVILSEMGDELGEIIKGNDEGGKP